MRTIGKIIRLSTLDIGRNFGVYILADSDE